jgi:hypothetical protein
MSPDQFSVAANISTILTCIVAMIAMGVSVRQFSATQKSTRETQAVELFMKFNQLNIEQGLSSNIVSDHWYNNCKFAITESLYEIANKLETWKMTVKWMLKQQEAFILAGNFAVETYSEEFRSFCKANGYELKSKPA